MIASPAGAPCRRSSAATRTWRCEELIALDHRGGLVPLLGGASALSETLREGSAIIEAQQSDPDGPPCHAGPFSLLGTYHGRTRPEPVFRSQRMYLKDLVAARAAHSPKILLEQQQPQVDIQSRAVRPEGIRDGIFEALRDRPR